MPVLHVPSPFAPAQAAGWFDVWASSCDRDDLRLALRPCAILEPAGLVLLAAGIARRRAAGKGTWLSAADPGGDALALLQGIDFFRELGVEPELESRPAPSRPWVPIRRIADLAMARAQADATRELLERSFPSLPPSTVRAAEFVFEELGANVVQHSGAPDTGFGLATVDPEKRRIQVAFADAGMGFYRSLGSNPEFTDRVADDAEAIRLALDKRVGREGSGNIGIGLFLLSSLAERLRGELWIATGNALLARTDGKGRRTERIERTAGWQGAWLCLDAPVPGW